MDDASVIQAAINNTKANGGGIVHIKQGNYIIKSSISLISLSNSTIRGDGIDATVLRASGTPAGILVKNDSLATSNIVISDLTLDGSGIANCQQLNLAINTSNVIIQRLKFKDGGNASPNTYLASQTNTSIIDCIFQQGTAMGGGDLCAVGGTDVHVMRCDFSRSTPGEGLTTGGLTNSIFANNTFHNHIGNTISLENFANIDGILITGNQILDTGGYSGINTTTNSGIGVLRHINISSNYLVAGGMTINGIIQSKIEDNVLKGCPGISTAYPIDLIIANNLIDSTTTTGVTIFEDMGEGVIITGNIISNAQNNGIWLRSVNHFAIQGNIVRNCGLAANNTYDGIGLHNWGTNHCTKGLVSGNVISSNSVNKPRYCIFGENADSIQIQTNHLSGFATDSLTNAGLGWIAKDNLIT